MNGGFNPAFPERRMSRPRLLALIVAVVAFAVLAIRLLVSLTTPVTEARTVGAEIWRLLGFFTILTNITVMIVAAWMAFRPGPGLAGPRVRMAAAVAIALVGLVYTIALRHQWDPKGWMAVADHGLHDVVPVLFVVAWAVAADGSLKWRDAAWAMVMPVAYCAYALIRGAAEGWYPYWFIDANKLSTVTMIQNIAILASAFLVFGFLFVGLDKLIGRRR